MIFIISSIICCIFFYILSKKYNLKFKYLLIFISIIFFSLFLEFGIFNFRHYESLLYKNNFEKFNINNYKGIKKRINSYEIVDKNNYIEIKNINKKTNNIYLDIINDNAYKTNLDIYAKDEGNKLYYKLPSILILKNIENSKFIKLNLNGKTNSLKLVFNYESDKNHYIINEISANKIKPVFISKIRILFITLSLYLLYLIRPKSELYKYKLLEKKYKKEKIAIILIYLLFQIFIFFLLTNINPAFTKLKLDNQIQYNKLAISLSKGKVNIGNANKELTKLKNPYDTNYREKMCTDKKNCDYHWDHAYYKGKYYVYFGVMPVIIAYLPYYIITGNQLPNYIYIFGCLSLISIGIMLLLKELIKKYFKNTSFIHYILMSILFINSSFLLYAAKRPDLYSVPILSAILFTIFGLYFWFRSTNDDENINKKYLLLGSFSMALVAGCRPQFLISSFFSFIIFRDYIKNNKNNRKKIICDVLIALLPYIIVAILIMYYNKIRFGSPFDFGANYNLTGNDMTKRGFKFDRIFSGLYYSLINPSTIIPYFPFILPNKIYTKYMGVTIAEPQFGGIIYNNLILLFCCLSFKFKNIIKNKTIYLFSLMCLLFSVIVIIIDIEGAGILPRYLLDFSYLLFLATSIVVFALSSNLKNDKLIDIFKNVFIILFVLSIIYNLILIPVDLSLGINEFNETLYYKIENIIQFW